MRVAILGPLCKDEVIIDGKKTYTGIGSPVYYIGTALKNLGVDVTAFATFAEEDLGFMQQNMQGINLVHLPAEKTLSFVVEYSSKNPDERVHRTNYVDNIITKESLADYDFSAFHYVIFGPLFYNNTSEDIFQMVYSRNKNIILGNFGMFTYSEGAEMVKKHPENLVAVLKYLRYLFLDADEIMFVAQKKSVKEAIDLLQAYISKIIVTKASAGSSVFIGGTEYEIPAYPPKKLVDPTGAGDCYLAGFVRALELFSDTKRRGQFAAMVATDCIERKGSSQISVEQVYARLGWK